MIKPKCPHCMDYVPSAEYVQVYYPHPSARSPVLLLPLAALLPSSKASHLRVLVDSLSRVSFPRHQRSNTRSGSLSSPTQSHPRFLRLDVQSVHCQVSLSTLLLSRGCPSFQNLE